MRGERSVGREPAGNAVISLWVALRVQRLNVQRSFCYVSARGRFCSSTNPPRPVPTAGEGRGGANGRVVGLRPPAPFLPPRPLPSSAPRGKCWGGILGELGRLSLQKRLGQIPGTAIGPCREGRRAGSQAAPGAAQQQDRRLALQHSRFPCNAATAALLLPACTRHAAEHVQTVHATIPQYPCSTLSPAPDPVSTSQKPRSHLSPRGFPTTPLSTPGFSFHL